MSASQSMVELLKACEDVLGLSLSLHAPLGGMLPNKWHRHNSPVCIRNKRMDRAVCLAYDMRQVHQELEKFPGGRVQTCPFGVTELAVPLIRGGRVWGVLFAGPIWKGKGPAPSGEMKRGAGAVWLRKRLTVLRAIAHQILTLVPERQHPRDQRADRIMSFLQRHYKRSPDLAELSAHLSLSPSRTRHLVVTLFGRPFSRLLNEIRLDDGARLLRITALSVGEVAQQIGYHDQNYFTRVFAKRFGLSPRAFRNAFLREL